MAQSKPYDKIYVLVVEDEPLLRMLAVDVVEEAGFEAIEAANADIAVGILETRHDVRIVFTDIDMPGSLDGMKLAAVIRDRWPPIDIIITSGKMRAHDLDLQNRAVFFAKPYNTEQVAATLQSMAAH